MDNSILKLFNTEYPIVQGGMIWCSGWEFSSAVSNAGGLGLIGSGSMYPEVLVDHIRKCKAATKKPFGVNIPLLYPNIEEHIHSVIEEGVKVVFTSAGNPATWTKKLKENGITVVHVTANTKFAKKSEDAGVDAIVAEGFEAGGHNRRGNNYFVSNSNDKTSSEDTSYCGWWNRNRAWNVGCNGIGCRWRSDWEPICSIKRIIG